MPDILTQLEVGTRRYINNQPKLRDLVFNRDPLMAMLQEECLEEIDGGTSWNYNMEYDVQDGGAYTKGQDLPAEQRQIMQQLRFDPKFQTVLITFYKEDIRVINNGSEEKVLSLVETNTNAAFMQLGAQTAIQLYLQAQIGSYLPFINGMTEGLSDGVNGGWDGNTYPSYGTLTRSLYGGRMFSPTPYNFAGGQISLPVMDNMYQSVNYGSGEYEPNVIMTTAQGFGYIRSNFQTQQRFQNVAMAKGGFRGLEYNGATILSSRYAPGSYLMKNNGTNDRNAYRFLTYSTQGAITSYPTPANMTNATVNPSATVYGETIWFLNVRKPNMLYQVSSEEPFNGSLDDDGFIPNAGNTKLVGKVLLSHNMMVLPGYHTYGFNFTS